MLGQSSIRLASISEDHWQLGENPSWSTVVKPLFESASEEQLPIGHSVKLQFHLSLVDSSKKEVAAIENMWVAPVERIGAVYIGLLTSMPALLESCPESLLVQFMEVPFRLEHVFDYFPQTDDDAAWIMGVEPKRIWPRNYQ
jgi:hypothetical protein